MRHSLNLILICSRLSRFLVTLLVPDYQTRNENQKQIVQDLNRILYDWLAINSAVNTDNLTKVLHIENSFFDAKITKLY